MVDELQIEAFRLRISRLVESVGQVVDSLETPNVCISSLIREMSI